LVIWPEDEAGRAGRGAWVGVKGDSDQLSVLLNLGPSSSEISVTTRIGAIRLYTDDTIKSKVPGVEGTE
jgi:hypothetical protein